jgi:anti-sigma factor (TIGR02949 family)
MWLEGGTMKCEEMRELLDAFHDGELQPATLAAVETHLRTCPSCSAALAAHEALRAKVRSLARTPAPEQLAAKIRKSLTELDTEARSEAFGVRSWRAMAASHFLAIAIGGAAVFGLIHGQYARSFAVQETIDAHVRSLIDERTLLQVASDDSHNVRPWFMGKLDFSPAVAELNKEEFPLLGARVDYLANRYVAALVYGRRKHRINLFVAPADGVVGAGITSTARNGYNILEWQAGGLSYRAVSDIDAAELAQFAELVRAHNKPS